MKKQIKDLRLGDTIYKYNGADIVSEFKITMLSENRIEFKDPKASYVKGHFELKSEDLSRWTFESTETYPSKFYLEKLDVLKLRRESLDHRLTAVFKAQSDFLENLKNLNQNIRDSDKDIVNELLKNKSQL